LRSSSKPSTYTLSFDVLAPSCFVVPLDAPKLSHSSSNPPIMRPGTRPIVKTSESRLEPNPHYAEAMVKEEWGLPATQTSTTPGKSVTKNLPTGAAYGLHPEEGPGKSKEDTRTEVVRLNMEQNQLNAQIEELNSELSQTRTNLSNLRNRLLEDNMTQYLEVNGNSPTRNIRSERLTTFETAATVSPGATMRNSGGSFLSRARALATKSFGSVIGGSTSQPNLTNPVMMSPRHSISPPSPTTTRPGGSGVRAPYNSLDGVDIDADSLTRVFFTTVSVQQMCSDLQIGESNFFTPCRRPSTTGVQRKKSVRIHSCPGTRCPPPTDLRWVGSLLASLLTTRPSVLANGLSRFTVDGSYPLTWRAALHPTHMRSEYGFSIRCIPKMIKFYTSKQMEERYGGPMTHGRLPSVRKSRATKGFSLFFDTVAISGVLPGEAEGDNARLRHPSTALHVVEMAESMTTVSEPIVHYLDALTIQIGKFFQENRQTSETYLMKVELKNSLHSIISNVLPGNPTFYPFGRLHPHQSLSNLKFYIVGSSLNGFGVNQSSLDLCLADSKAVRQVSRIAVLMKRNLLSHFSQGNKPRKGTGLIQSDLNFVLKSSSKGAKNGASATSVLRKIMSALRQAGASYLYYFFFPASMKLIYYVLPVKKVSMNLKLPWSKMRSANRSTLSELFAGFITYYATFDFTRWAISIRHGRPLSIDDELSSHASFQRRQVRYKCKIFIEDSEGLSCEWYYGKIAVKFDDHCVRMQIEHCFIACPPFFNTEPFRKDNVTRCISSKKVAGNIRRAFRRTDEVLRELKPLESLWEKALPPSPTSKDAKRSTVAQSDPAPRYLGSISARMVKFFQENRQTPRRPQMSGFSLSSYHFADAYLFPLLKRIDPRFLPLGLVVKDWAQVMNIYGASRGRLSTFTLLLIAIQYLQCGCTPPVLPNLQAHFPKLFQSRRPVEEVDIELRLLWGRIHSTNKSTLGELFAGFIAHYLDCDFDRWAISARLGQPFSLIEKVKQLPVCYQIPFALAYVIFVEVEWGFRIVVVVVVFIHSTVTHLMPWFGRHNPTIEGTAVLPIDRYSVEIVEQAFRRTDEALRAQMPLGAFSLPQPLDALVIHEGTGEPRFRLKDESEIRKEEG
uniref:PAP-associated domain-containing protein n=1 Tax=Taenia asiatica TaxID=60517 RepID=A0A158R730_TAEAS